MSYERRRKKTIKKTGDDPNWDIKRMQLQKEQATLSSISAYVNVNSKAEDVKKALGSSR
jgi:hypothetical protein